MNSQLAWQKADGNELASSRLESQPIVKPSRFCSDLQREEGEREREWCGKHVRQSFFRFLREGERQKDTNVERCSILQRWLNNIERHAPCGQAIRNRKFL